MPGPLSSANVVVGLYGKLPARGDFVRAGLPRDFTDRWDDWLQSVIAGSRTLMGDSWLPAFLEAPVWRFSLPPGMCGERAVLGLMLPSVDKAGRYFPLTFAALGIGGIAAESIAGNAWLDRCEEAGRAALEQDRPPQDVSDMLGLPDLSDEVTKLDAGVWWSEGSARVKPSRIMLHRLPEAAAFAAMLGAEATGTDTPSEDPRREAPRETTWESAS
jgi:type VI secretion system protein ImpM